MNLGTATSCLLGFAARVSLMMPLACDIPVTRGIGAVIPSAILRYAPHTVLSVNSGRGAGVEVKVPPQFLDHGPCLCTQTLSRARCGEGGQLPHQLPEEECKKIVCL